MTTTLGIAAHYHDSAAAIIKDGKLLAAAQEERFTRIKHDPAFPKYACQYCLDEAGITISEVDCVAYYENPHEKLQRNIWMGMKSIRTFFYNSLLGMRCKKPEWEIRNLLGYEGPIHITNHHMSHAASSYYCSGFSHAALCVIDGVGEWQTISFYGAEDNRINYLTSIEFPHSIGLLYSTITAFLGFEVNDGEYKVMGLAPYGTDRYVDAIRRCIKKSTRNHFVLDMSYFDFLKNERMYSDKMETLFGCKVRRKESEINQVHKDIAKSLQIVLEELLLEKVRYLYERYPSDNLCLSGGVALNCVANARIHKEGPFKNVFVQPASSDAGGALGAAILGYNSFSEKPFCNHRLTDVFLGPSYADLDIQMMISNHDSEYSDFTGNEDGLAKHTASLLEQGKVIGWFQGRMEFGPRALGARSILADPRITEMRKKINLMVKKREGFRPFAPAVLQEYLTEHFDLSWESPFMLETCQVISDLELHAVTHVDGSARIQSVGEDAIPRFRKLLKAFHEKTGCPILLNTSFNMRGEPIVCTPIEAILCFIRTELDALVLGSCILYRDKLSSKMLEWYDKTFPVRREGVSNSVYTFI